MHPAYVMLRQTVLCGGRPAHEAYIQRGRSLVCYRDPNKDERREGQGGSSRGAFAARGVR